MGQHHKAEIDHSLQQNHEEEKGLFDDDSELEELSPSKSTKRSPKKVRMSTTSPLKTSPNWRD